MEIACRVYKPRRPRESPLYQLVERHLEELLRVWPERFARRHGPLRAVVERVLREFLRCGLLEHGFARLWCGPCRRSVLVAFSCRGRSFCPSCEKKKQLLWAECPDSGQHKTLFYGEYANRVRGQRQPAEADASPLPAEPTRKRCSPSWARLIAKVYQVDPLLCVRCGKRMSIVAFVTGSFAIRKILDHLGLSTPEAEKPPPLREVLRVAEHGQGWGVPAEWE